MAFPDVWSGQKPWRNWYLTLWWPWSPEGQFSQIHSAHLHDGAPGIFSGFLRSVQIRKREWGAESNGKLPHLFIPSKGATLVPEFAVEYLPLGRTAALLPEFAVKDLRMDRMLWLCYYYYYYYYYYYPHHSYHCYCSVCCKFIIIIIVIIILNIVVVIVIIIFFIIIII